MLTSLMSPASSTLPAGAACCASQRALSGMKHAVRASDRPGSDATATISRHPMKFCKHRGGQT